MGIPWWGWTIIGFGGVILAMTGLFLWGAVKAMQKDDCDHHA